MAKLVIVGASEIARMAYEYFTHDSEHEVVAFAAESTFIEEPEFLGKPLVDFAKMEESFPPDSHMAFVAIGSAQLNRIRARFFEEAKAKNYRLASYVSSRAFVWHNVSIGENCFILEDNTLQPFVKIGDDVTLWSGNHIGHGSTIDDHVFIASHVVISGLCEIGRYSFLGVNAAMAENTVIAEDNFIAMGAAVTRSTQADQVLTGNPAEAQKVNAKRFCRVKS